MSAQHQKSLSGKKLINQETKHKIQRVKPDSEAVSSESIAVVRMNTCTPVVPTNRRKCPQ